MDKIIGYLILSCLLGCPFLSAQSVKSEPVSMVTWLRVGINHSAFSNNTLMQTNDRLLSNNFAPVPSQFYAFDMEWVSFILNNITANLGTTFTFSTRAQIPGSTTSIGGACVYMNFGYVILHTKYTLLHPSIGYSYGDLSLNSQNNGATINQVTSDSDGGSSALSFALTLDYLCSGPSHPNPMFEDPNIPKGTHEFGFGMIASVEVGYRYNPARAYWEDPCYVLGSANTFNISTVYISLKFGFGSYKNGFEPLFEKH